MSGAVAIVRFSALGDVAMTLPLVYDVCRTNVDRKFVFITRELPARMFVNPPENLTVVAIDTSQYKGLPGLLRLACKLKKEYGFETWIDLHDVLRTRILDFFMWLSGVRVVVYDKMRGARRALTRSKNKIMQPLPPVCQRYAKALHKAGLHSELSFKALDFKPDDLSAHMKSPDEKWIGIAPFAAHKGKIYPLPKMREVVAALASHQDCRIFIFGAGKKEIEEIDYLAEGFQHVVNMAAMQLGLRAEMALMTKLDVMLSMDSANMHLARLAGTRVVSVWGATHPFCGFADPEGDSDDMIQLDMTCRPCSVFGNRECQRGDYFCLEGINPRLIVERILKIIGEKK